MCYVVVGQLGALDYQNILRHVNIVSTAGRNSILEILVKTVYYLFCFHKFRKCANTNRIRGPRSREDLEFGLPKPVLGGPRIRDRSYSHKVANSDLHILLMTAQ
jgi:hypothetical protein